MKDFRFAQEAPSANGGFKHEHRNPHLCGDNFYKYDMMQLNT